MQSYFVSSQTPAQALSRHSSYAGHVSIKEVSVCQESEVAWFFPHTSIIQNPTAIPADAEMLDACACFGAFSPVICLLRSCWNIFFYCRWLIFDWYLIHINTNWERLYRFLPNPNAPFIPGATWEPWRIPPAICVTTLGGRLHVTTCTWDRKLTVKFWMAVSYIQACWWPKKGRFLGLG